MKDEDEEVKLPVGKVSICPVITNNNNSSVTDPCSSSYLGLDYDRWIIDNYYRSNPVNPFLPKNCTCGWETVLGKGTPHHADYCDKYEVGR